MGKRAGAASKRQWWKVLVELIVIVGLIWGIRAWHQRTLIQGEAPTFSEQTLNGAAITLQSYQGKPVMLHFWATWCSMCELEQGGISKIAQDWSVITIAYQSGEEEEVKRYMERRGIQQWTTIVDHDGELAKQYGVVAVPTSYILDSNGHIRFREVGLSSSWGLKIRLWLADKLSSVSKSPAMPATALSNQTN